MRTFLFALLFVVHSLSADMYLEIRGKLSNFDEKTITLESETGESMTIPRRIVSRKIALRPGMDLVLPVSGRELKMIQKFHQANQKPSK